MMVPDHLMEEMQFAEKKLMQAAIQLENLEASAPALLCMSRPDWNVSTLLVCLTRLCRSECTKPL